MLPWTTQPSGRAIQASFETMRWCYVQKPFRRTALVFGSALVIFSLWQFFGNKRVPREKWDVQTNLKQSETSAVRVPHVSVDESITHCTVSSRIADAEPPAEMLACAKIVELAGAR